MKYFIIATLTAACFLLSGNAVATSNKCESIYKIAAASMKLRQHGIRKERVQKTVLNTAGSTLARAHVLSIIEEAYDAEKKGTDKAKKRAAVRYGKYHFDSCKGG